MIAAIAPNSTVATVIVVAIILVYLASALITFLALIQKDGKPRFLDIRKGFVQTLLVKVILESVACFFYLFYQVSKPEPPIPEFAMLPTDRLLYGEFPSLHWVLEGQIKSVDGGKYTFDGKKKAYRKNPDGTFDRNNLITIATFETEKPFLAPRDQAVIPFECVQVIFPEGRDYGEPAPGRYRVNFRLLRRTLLDAQWSVDVGGTKMEGGYFFLDESSYQWLSGRK